MLSTDSDAAPRASTTPWLWRALTVAERLATPELQGGALPVITTRQLERWRALPALQPDGVWLRKVASTPRLDPAAWQSQGQPMPQPPAEPSTERKTDGWIQRLASAYPAQAPEQFTPWPLPQEASPAASPLRPWLQMASPLVEPALAALTADASAAGAEQQPPLIDVAAWRHDWLAILEQQLLPLMVRTLTLELQVARLRGDLEGDTPEARFAAFGSRLARRDVCGALIDEYPVLARQLAEHVSTWQAIGGQFLRRLEEDVERLQVHFGGGRPLGALTKLQARGDRHRGGQTVMVCVFASGVRVVYKPRSLAVEQHFQALLKDLNARGFEPAFRTLTVLDRGTHGWVEFVTAQPCEDRDALARFYRRQGAHLALLHALAATDFHYENLIAAGEHPVLLDLEALFHTPRLEAESTSGAHRRASDCLSASVLRVGLLPWRGPDDEQGRSLDVGGLTARADGAEGPLQLGIESAGRDEMRLVRKPSRLDTGQHLPELAGNTVRLEEHLADIDAGFKAMYELLLRHRMALLAEGGPLQAFGGAETRVILRGSEAYARLLQESLHPDLLRDAVDRDRHFDQLWGAFPNTDRFDGLIASEQDDLRQGDIPIFTCRPAARDLWDSRGRCHKGLLPESPLQRVRQRLCAFDADDLAFQRWLIRMAMAAELTPAKDGAGTSAPGAGVATSAPAAPTSLHGIGVARRLHAQGPDGTDARTLLAAARDIGDRLAATAFRADGSAT